MNGIRVRSLAAIHGWRWIAGGMAIFRRNPPLWIAMVMIVYVVHLLLSTTRFGIALEIVLTPNLIAGMCHGCEALTQGKPLRIGYLASGFLKSALVLLMFGVASLAAKLLAEYMTMAIAGEAIAEVQKAVAAGMADPEAVETVRAAMRAAAPQLTSALVMVTAITLPVTMAMWFAPLLVFFDDLRPMGALALSLWACMRNVLAFLVYGGIVMAVLMVLMPLSYALRQLDLGFWLLAPILIPSLYVSYRDVYLRA
jgi:hypothetical protein